LIDMVPALGLWASMRRRDFIQLIAGTAASWPVAIHAQQLPKWRIGFLSPGSLNPVTAQRIAAFSSGIGQGGFAEIEIVARYADNQLDRLPALAQELVEQGVRAITAAAPSAVGAARRATSAIPIVAMDLESDPVADGWATSLAHPGSNVTGVFLDLPGFSAKTLQLLRDAVPGLSNVAVFWLPASGTRQLDTVRSAAAGLELKLEVLEVGRPSEFEGAFQAAARSKASGVLMLSSPLIAANPQVLADLALVNRLPAISIFPDFAQKGGLVAYGPDLLELYPQAAVMTRKLLQGASAADLPIERPTRFKLIANLKTAKALDLTLPTSILLSADEVIE
jgi:putative tryptophan/tyrosine transport system substrate-binding protein